MEPMKRCEKRFASLVKCSSSARPARRDFQRTTRLRRSEIRFESPFRLDRESDRDIGGTVECLENLVAEQATIFSLRTGPGRQFDAPIAGMAGRTGQVGFLHADVMPRPRAAFQSGPDHISFV